MNLAVFKCLETMIKNGGSTDHILETIPLDAFIANMDVEVDADLCASSLQIVQHMVRSKVLVTKVAEGIKDLSDAVLNTCVAEEVHDEFKIPALELLPDLLISNDVRQFMMHNKLEIILMTLINKARAWIQKYLVSNDFTRVDRALSNEVDKSLSIIN